MWIAIFGAFVLVTVLFGKSEHREKRGQGRSCSARRRRGRGDGGTGSAASF